MIKSVDTVNHLQPGAQVDVLALVHEVMHEYRSLQYRMLREGPLHITHMDGKTLEFFATHPGATQSEFAQRIGRDKSQLARLVGPLCDKGLLERALDESDKRIVRLNVTTTGQAVLRSIHDQAQRLSARAVSRLSDAETRKLVALLLCVKDSLGER